MPALGFRLLLGGCGTGRTSLLLRLRDLIGHSTVAVHRRRADCHDAGTLPRRAPRRVAVRIAPPERTRQGRPGARAAFDASLAFLDTRPHRGGAPATFLLDEFLELRTFESFPGLRTVLRDLVGVLGASGNRFVLTTRYMARAQRLLRDAPSQFEIIHGRAADPGRDSRHAAGRPGAAHDRAARSRTKTIARATNSPRLVEAIADGRPSYARMIAEASATLGPRGAPTRSAR